MGNVQLVKDAQEGIVPVDGFPHNWLHVIVLLNWKYVRGAPIRKRKFSHKQKAQRFIARSLVPH